MQPRSSKGPPSVPSTPNPARLSLSPYVSKIIAVVVPLLHPRLSSSPALVTHIAYQTLVQLYHRLSVADRRKHMEPLTHRVLPHIRTHGCPWARCFLDLLTRTAQSPGGHVVTSQLYWKSQPSYLFGKHRLGQSAICLYFRPMCYPIAFTCASFVVGLGCFLACFVCVFVWVDYRMYLPPWVPLCPGWVSLVRRANTLLLVASTGR